MIPATITQNKLPEIKDPFRSADRQLREQFRKDVIKGLGATEKYIPSKYFYDAVGDRLFQQIMASPDYYLTRSETEIFKTQNSALTRALADGMGPFEVIELGAGDGTKTRHLFKKWLCRDQKPVYRPIDISANALRLLGQSMASEFPNLKVASLQGEYFDVLDKLPPAVDVHKVFLFLGSNIGNMERKAAVELLRAIAVRMHGEDRLLVGLDLKKSPAIIRKAYNDRAGITRQFNFNLLHRINKELGADLHLDQFSHEPIYDPQEGRAMSFMVSKQDQLINIPGAPTPIAIKAWEAIHTETSYKYDMPLIEAIADGAGLRVRACFTDKKQYFVDVVLGLKSAVL